MKIIKLSQSKDYQSYYEERKLALIQMSNDFKRDFGQEYGFSNEEIENLATANVAKKALTDIYSQIDNLKLLVNSHEGYSRIQRILSQNEIDMIELQSAVEDVFGKINNRINAIELQAKDAIAVSKA